MSKTFIVEAVTETSSQAMLAKATAAKDAYLAELVKYPNIRAEAKQIDPTSPWTKWNIQVYSTNTKDGDDWRDVINFEVTSVRWSKVNFTAEAKRYVWAGSRNHLRRYKNFGTANLRKIAKEVSELERAYLEHQKRGEVAAAVNEQWQAIRRSKLTGLAIHPCLRINIIGKSEPPTAEDVTNPTFIADFNNYTTSRLSGYSLTTEQVSKLCRVIAEITGLDKAWAIVKMAENGGVCSWDGSWFTRILNIAGSLNTRAYPTREAAQTELDKIVAVHGKNGEGAMIVPFSQLV